MSEEQDKNYVSVGFWMFAMFVMTLPCIGLIMIIVWAFVGDNESRKNYFRAILAWFALGKYGNTLESIFCILNPFQLRSG